VTNAAQLLMVSSAAQAIDSDSLSIVFSFLAADDFLCAVSVNRQWHSLRTRPAAWPSPLQPCGCLIGKLIPILVSGLHSADEAQQLHILHSLHRWKGNNARTVAIDVLIDSGIIQTLEAILSHSDSSLSVFLSQR
jgi:hypothetical protein